MVTWRWRAILAAAALQVGLIGCSDRLTTSTDMVFDPSPVGGVDSTFAAVQHQVLDRSCALPGCHADTQYPVLTAGQAYAAVVRVPGSTGMNLVTPGDTASSFLYIKITGASGLLGARMPYDSAPLGAADIALVRAWILRGAPND